jgi:hypothetical protein
MAWAQKHGPSMPPAAGITYTLAQALGEACHTSRGTNNVGCMHATEAWAKAHAKDRGFGMVAFRDSGPNGSYITRLRVSPSPLVGARAFLDAVESNVNLGAVQTSLDFARDHYVHGYFTGWHPTPAERAQGWANTPLMERAAAVRAGTLTQSDWANIAAYSKMIEARTGEAIAAFTAAAAEPGDPSVVNVGPPFASLAERLTPDGPPHTIEEARRRLGAAADHPPAGAISLQDALDAPGGDGVWMFPIAEPKPDPRPEPKRPAAASSSGGRVAAALATAVVVAIAGAGVAAASGQPKRRAA